ncbi:hypothetical protein [Halalkalicoccus tibetensis]|uniref:Uncharacterized protein n=1 Tax=Halalkalicoccus tibetensis TaxID=175632 RepID=A0ABD5UXB9_9EURY
MDEITLAVPRELGESLPEDGEETLMAMQREIDQYEGYINGAVPEGESEAASAAADVIDRLEERWEQYDEYIVELRAWGQSSIYAEVWCDFQYALIQQIYDHEELADALDQERHARLVDDGIRLSDAV